MRCQHGGTGSYFFTDGRPVAAASRSLTKNEKNFVALELLFLLAKSLISIFTANQSEWKLIINRSYCQEVYINSSKKVTKDVVTAAEVQFGNCIPAR